MDPYNANCLTVGKEKVKNKKKFKETKVFFLLILSRKKHKCFLRAQYPYITGVVPSGTQNSRIIFMMKLSLLQNTCILEA